MTTDKKFVNTIKNILLEYVIAEPKDKKRHLQKILQISIERQGELILEEYAENILNDLGN